MDSQQLIVSTIENDPIALPVANSGTSSSASSPIAVTADEAED